MAKETSGLIMEYSSSYRKFNKTRKEQEKAPTEPVQTADTVPTFDELYNAYQRRHANDHFTREAHKHLSEIARRRQRDEQERIIQTEERERKYRP